MIQKVLLILRLEIKYIQLLMIREENIWVLQNFENVVRRSEGLWWARYKAKSGVK
jgi:hypothetical protein